MGIINKIFTSVSGLYSSLNPLTLSGVNDIIVVIHPDGTLKCSPFQLRFSKLHFYNSKSQIVHLYINGVLTDVNMTITSQGDLFFEQDIAKESALIDRVVDYIQSTEQDINTILESKKLTVKWSISEEELFKIRKKNLEIRQFWKQNSRNPDTGLYHILSSKFNKVFNLLGSSEHLAGLLEKKNEVLNLFYCFINNSCPKGCCGASFAFSACLNNKLEQSMDETFDNYLAKELDGHDNIVVKLEGCKDYPSRFYLSYALFSKIFFELKIAKNRNKRLIEILENEYNRALGWNLFGSRQPLKRDISFSLILNSNELKSLNLNIGRNEAVFKISGCNRQLEGCIYLWNAEDKVIVSDIDGTITKSDLRGHLYNLMGKDWTHTGVAALFSRIVKNGYKIIYLTSRPLGHSKSTKNYLKGITQDSIKLPDGPVLLSPDGVFGAIYREIIIKRPEDFKIHCLKTIAELFDPFCPFVAGFGNRITDVCTYKALKIPNSKIYTINPEGQLQAEYTGSLVGTYHTMNEFIDSIFPNIHSKRTEDDNSGFSDFSWWK